MLRRATTAKVTVTGVGGRTKQYSAKLIGFNPDKDVAVLKIAADSAVRLQPLAVGADAPVRVGQAALAIGNPFGLDHSLTLGIISGLNREVTSPTGRPISNVIQTDAAINPGNSGGALLDSSGRLIGMNTAILSPSGTSAGIGFAIPAETLKQQVPLLIRDGKVLRPAIGISFAQPPQARALGVTRGVLVLGVTDGSAAAKAGLRGTRGLSSAVRLGDVIIELAGTKVKNDADLFRALDACKPGQTTSVRVARLDDDGAERELTLPLQLQAAEAA